MSVGHFATNETIRELDNVRGWLEDEHDPEQAARVLRTLLYELYRAAEPEDDREPIQPGDYHYYDGG